MQEIERKLRAAKAQFESGKISEEVYKNIKINLENKLSQIKSLNDLLAAGQIDGKEYNTRMNDIIFFEEIELENFEKKKTKRKNIIYVSVTIFILVLIGGFFLGREVWKNSIKQQNTVTISSVDYISEPQQIPTSNNFIKVRDGDADVHISFLAAYSLSGRVFGKTDHRFSYIDDTYAHLSPIDLVVGWGALASQPKALRATTSGSRTTSIECLDLAYCDAGMISHTHFIPQNDDIRTKLQIIDIGDLVKIDGFLVSVESKNAEPWTSSLDRRDRHSQGWILNGLGKKVDMPYACEIMYVIDMKWLEAE